MLSSLERATWRTHSRVPRRASSRRRVLALAIFLALPLSAQFGLPPAPPVLLEGHFLSPLKYEVALERLDKYYDEQVGRKIAIALPVIAPGVHFDVWHDMWVFFEPEGDKLSVTIKRAADSVTTRLGKGWMLEIAGRLDGETPLTFKELPRLHSAETDIYGSHKDLENALASQPAMKPLRTWEHAGLIVAAAPMTSVMLSPGGLHGIHHLTVTAENPAAAKQLVARLTAALAKPGISAAYSESAEIDEEIRLSAREKADDTGANTARKIYLSFSNPQAIEDGMRAEPEMQKRISAAAGHYDIRYRIDKAYAKVNVRWTELAGYSREDGKFQGERPLGQSSLTGARPAAGAPLIARTKLEPLKPGAYRIAIEGETAAGQKVSIDVRDFWFDGKTFEEL